MAYKKSKRQTQTRKAARARDLAPQDAKAVKGGKAIITVRKAGEGQQDY